ncbi:MAG: hypothetical protein IPM92_11320 [Saprospiraceae bacterium]|nr:hypothetical protein [Saprospiraceae bacterium]
MKSSIAFSVFFLYLSTLTWAVNYHVKFNGNDTNDGLSFNTAFKTIQTATNKVKAGDSVLVYDGLYKGFDHFYKNSGEPGKEIVYFAKGRNVIINQSCGRGFDGLNIEGSHYIQVVGFKVQKISDPVGSGEDGIRAVLANHITIRDCEVDSCYRGIFTGYTDDFLAESNLCKNSYGEHGIYVSNNSDRVVIRFNLCYGNSKAAGIQLNPDLSSGSPGISIDVKIYNNICYNNRIGLNLQGIYYSQVYNNLLYNNGSGGGGNGITLFHGDAATGCNDVKIYNNTVIVPAASQWCILAIDGDSLFVKNNILLSASAKGSLDIESSCTNYFGDYNLLTDKMTVDQGASYINFAMWKAMGHDQNSISTSSLFGVFENITNNNFELSETSAAIDAGTNEVSDLVKVDLLNNPRPQRGKYDMGCFEKFNFTEVANPKGSNKYKLLDSGPFFTFENLTIDFELHLVDMNGRMWINEPVIDKKLFAPGLYIYLLFNKKTEELLNSGKIWIGN